MRIVLQRVREASVDVAGRRVGSIGPGLLLLVGVAADDGAEDADWLAARVAALKIFETSADGVPATLAESGGEALCVSQFTLLASTRKGARPSWHRAAPAGTAAPLFDAFCRLLEERLGRRPARGEFGADMQVALVNDGPVTLILDSKVRE